MNKFLEQIAEEIIRDYGNNNSRHTVIVPNKRSEIFLKNYLKEKTEKTLWLPQFFTIDEFIANGSGLAAFDPVLTYFVLYDIHKEIQKEEAMPLEDFLSWAPIMLSDFNDIDLQQADADHVFRHLTEAKAIEQWNLEQRPLTQLQKNYLFFYQSLFTYYSELRKRLAKRGVGYKGMIYRHLSENILSLSQKWNNHTFTFIGFNALSQTELKIFGYIHKNFPCRIYFDTDKYYIGDPPFFKGKSPAGRFIKEMISNWHLNSIKWTGNNLLTAKNKVEVYGVAKQVGQVKFAGKKLEGWFKEQDLEFDSINTAIVLADENMLIPLLHSLPRLKKNGKNIPYNITMGYPLAQSIMGRFVQIWINFLVTYTGKQAGGNFMTTDIIQLISSPVISFILNGIVENSRPALVQNLLNKGKVYISKQEFYELLSGKEAGIKPLFDTLLNGTRDALQFLDSLTSLLIILKDTIENTDQKAFPLLKEQMNNTFSLVQKSRLMLEGRKGGVSLKAFQKIWQQLMYRIEINLKGEPLEGIQVMGMLETRNLDFKNLIILSANEGILPKKGNLESFIPFDIRSDNHLPLPKEQNDISAYYFFRLLQRSERVTLIYNTDSDKFGGGEKSRFILQLEHELPQIFKNPDQPERLLHISTPANEYESSVSIAKGKSVMERIDEKARSGFSASSLNTYRNCPLKFYFSEILNLKEQQKIEPEIEFNVFGNAIHGVLETIYGHFTEKNIDPEKLKEFIPRVDQLLKEKLDENYKGGNIQTGKNHLIYEVAKKYITQFLQYEIKDKSTPFKQIIGLEERIKVTDVFGSHEVVLKGFLDRIERTETGDTRIIDYKTGKVTPSDLKLKGDDLLEEIASTNKDKLFQLLFYAYIYQIKQKSTAIPQLAIYSLRMLSYGLIKPNITDNLDFFREYLNNLIAEIFDSTIAFNQTDNDRICSYCDYKEICNR